MRIGIIIFPHHLKVRPAGLFTPAGLVEDMGIDHLLDVRYTSKSLTGSGYAHEAGASS